MIPLGYMAKRVVKRPLYLKAPIVRDIYSVSGCISTDFADYIPFWKHNGFWLFDSPEIILNLAREQAIDLSGTTMFFYEAYKRQYVESRAEWEPFGPTASFKTRVVVPGQKSLQGYDVVSFSAGNAPECSYLSCNHMAEKIEVNQHCLLEHLEIAIELINGGIFRDCEPGPTRILAVYTF